VSRRRLASGARLVILADEFQEQGFDVVFLNGSVESTPEGKLLLHMQGAIADTSGPR
jgi:DNA invertase Pin-like site-specific DNA recombinase